MDIIILAPDVAADAIDNYIISSVGLTDEELFFPRPVCLFLGKAPEVLRALFYFPNSSLKGFELGFNVLTSPKLFQILSFPF